MLLLIHPAKLNDGRISKENKTGHCRAKMNQGEGNPKPEYTIHTHSGLLDLFANSIRENNSLPMKQKKT